jgi:hypothetical protein
VLVTEERSVLDIGWLYAKCEDTAPGLDVIVVQHAERETRASLRAALQEVYDTDTSSLRICWIATM